MKKSPTKQKGKNQRKARVEKTTTGKPDDESKRKAEIEARIRRRVALEEKAFRLVEKLLESPISEEFLIEAAQSIDHNHYADVVEERAIIKLCGYPVCTKTLTNVPKQKYHISTKTNKVYDITERKNFCSPQCYKASKYFEKQLSTTPVWLREDEPPVLIELLSIDSNSGILGEVVFISPRAELKAELSELERVDSRFGPKNATGKQQQQRRSNGDNSDIYCKGEAIGRKATARSIFASKNSDGVQEGKDSTKNVHQVRTLRKSKDGAELNQKDDEGQVVGDHVESLSTTQDVHIFEGTGEPNSEGLPIEEVPRSISDLCLERSLKNLEYLDSEEATEQAHSGVLENVELWKDGDTSVRSTEDDVSVRNNEGCNSSIPSPEPLSIAVPSDDNLRVPNTQTEVPCLNAEQQQYNHATVPSLVSNHQCALDSLDSKTTSRSLASASEQLNTKESQATVFTPTDTTTLNSARSSQTAVLGTADEDTDGGKCHDLLEQGQQDMCTASKECVAAVSETEMTANTSWHLVESHQEDLHQEKQSSAVPEPDVGLAGLKTKATARCVASNKAKVLAELLDKRDELLTSLKAPVAHNADEQKDGAGSLRTSTNSLGFLQLIEDCSEKETSNSSAVSSAENRMNIRMPGQSECGDTAQVTSDGGKKSNRSAKVSSARFMANIQRASEQKNRIQKDSSTGLASSGQSSRQTSRISAEEKSQRKSKKKTKISVLQLIKQTLFDWKTEETARFLNKDVRQIADEVTDRYKKYSQMLAGREYSALLDDDVLDDDDDGTPHGKLPSMSQLQTDQIYAAKVMEFYGGLRQKQKEESKGRIEENAEKVTDPDVILPMVDSHSQMAHRRRIVLDKLNKVFPELLGPLKVSVTEVSAELRSLVYTFNLTNTNIILKPAEWTLIAYFLLHFLTLCCPSLKQAMEGEVATHYFKTMLLSLNISSSDVQQITEQMSSVAR